MIAITLSINDVPICGIVGPEGSSAEMVISAIDCNRIYRKYAKKAADGSLSVIGRQWRINGLDIDEPKSWFVTIQLG